MSTEPEHAWLSATEIHVVYFEQTGRRINTVKIGLEARRLQITKQQTSAMIEGVKKPVVLNKYAKNELAKLFEELNNKPDEPTYTTKNPYVFEQYALQASLFYSVGKDFGFDWLEENPDGTLEELITALLTHPASEDIPSAIARTTAEKIAARVFEVMR